MNRVKAENMPALPENRIDIVRDGFPQYILFQTVKRNVRDYLCTQCGHKWRWNKNELRQIVTPQVRFWDDAEVNQLGECPSCGCVAPIKNRKTFKPKWKERCVAFFLPVSEDDVWVRCVLFDKYGEAKFGCEDRITEEETNTYHLTPYRSAEFQRFQWRFGERVMTEVSHISEPFLWNHGFFCEKYGFDAMWIEQNGFRGMEDTFLRYFPYGQLEQYYAHERVFPLLKLICAYAKYPEAVECLVKCGIFEPVTELAEGNENKRIFDWEAERPGVAKKPWEIVRLPKQVYAVWKKDGADVTVRKLYREIHGNGVKDMETAVSIAKEVQYLHKCGMKIAQEVIALGFELDGRPDGFLRYLRRMEERYQGSCRWGYISLGTVCDEWMDYMDMAERLGVADKVPKFPHDLKEQHDKLVEMRNRQLDADYERHQKEAAEERRAREEARRKTVEEKHPGVAEAYARIRERYAWSDETFSVIVPTGAADIVEEGMQLYHCTGTSERYFDRIVSGESYIFFLRRASEPDKAWYTMEVEPGGTIRQKRSYHDEQNEDLQEAVPFLVKWQDRIRSQMDERALAEAMRAKQLREMEFAELIANHTLVKNGSLRGVPLADVLKGDLMEVLYEQKTGTAPEPAKEVKKA